MQSSSDFELPPVRLRASFSSAISPAADSPDTASQARAREAIEFGLAIEADGYNIAVAGPPASGRHALVLELVTASAGRGQDGFDWVYLYNFDDSRRPGIARLAAGQAAALAAGLSALVDSCREALPNAFGSESYERRVQEVLAPVIEARTRTIEMLQNTAAALGFAVNVTPMGLMAAPLGADGRPMDAEEYAQLPDEIRAPIEQRGERVQEALTSTLRQLRQLDTQAHGVVADVDMETTRFVVGPALEDLVQQYGEAGLQPYFQKLEADILEHLDVFKRFATGSDNVPPQLVQQFEMQRDEILDRYQANVFVVNEPGSGSPMVDESQPTYHNLFGRLEFEQRHGNLVTGFREIRSGAIHRANGGYLILHVEDLLADPRAWPKLKRSLNSREVRFDDAPGPFLLPVAGLEPDGIALEAKVILVGPLPVFAILAVLDHEFGELFKVRADFEPDVSMSAEAITAYATFVGRTCQECGLRPFDDAALKEVLFFGSRLADRQDRLSTRLGVVADLAKEANHFAGLDGAVSVTGTHVRAAVDARRRRSGMVPDRLRALIAERTLRIETTGAIVGQVNGLAVVGTGGEPFGLPMRISCRTGAGRGGVVAIERETERSGSIHTKGVLVLQGLLMGLFGRDVPLAFNASITFEQSYDEVEGDSASSAELYAILASLAEVPVRQDVAVTGSVDQFGNIQAVGGVTYKVEGFFDVCAAATLTGTQGVVVPQANVVNLNLRTDIIEAVESGRFHVWAVSRIEEAIALLTGLEAGVPGADGKFRETSVLGRAATRLAALRRHAAAPGHLPAPSEGDTSSEA